MVTQDPSPAASSEGVLRRSLTVAAIRRGDIKISEPIPLEEDVVVSSSPAQHRTQNSGGSSISQTSITAAAQQQPVVSDGDKVQIHDVLPEEEELQLESPPSEAPRSPPLRHKRASLSMREDSETQRQVPQIQQRHTTPVDQIMRDSMVPATDSPMSSGRGSVQKRGGKRSSGIRSVFKRLFSRREKSSPKASGASPQQQSTPSRQHGYHTSVSKQLNVPRSSAKSVQDPLPAIADDNTDQNAQPRRNTSPRDTRQSVLPSEDYTPSRPPQRLPFPMNINAPAESSPPHHYTSFETSPQVHRRRATLPSIVVSASDQATLQAYWGKSDPNLASPHHSTDRTPSPLIGMAISSGMNPKRRSRSAGALFEMAKLDEQAELRRRSAEIQYWRQSFQENVASSETGPTSECRSVRDDSMTSHPDESFADLSGDISVSDALADTSSSIRDEHIQHFDFGHLRDSNAEAAAHQFQEQDEAPLAPIDQRLSQLESSVLGLTNSLHELTGRAHRQTVLLGQQPEAKRARSYSPTPPVDAETKAAYAHHQKQPSFGLPANPKDLYPTHVPLKRMQPSPPSTASTNSTTKPSMRRLPDAYLSSPSSSGGALLTSQNLSPESLNFTPTSPQSAQRLSRSASAAAMSTASPLYSNPSTEDQAVYTHLAPLYSALRYERLQRKTLESKVEEMRQQINDLAINVARMRPSTSHAATMYPTPSPDRVYTAEVLDPVTANRQTSRFSASVYGESEAENASESHDDEEYDDDHDRDERDRHRHVHVLNAHGLNLNPIHAREHGGDDLDEYGSPLEKWSTPREEKSGWVHAGNLQMQEEVGSPRSIEGEMF
jgi:hypothetical protein